MSLDDAIAKLRQLNKKVPKPMRLPSDAEISVVEQELGVTFHPDCRQYLQEVSDVVFGTKEPATTTEPHGHTHLPDICQDARKIGVPQHLLPICEENGSFYCLESSGRVVYWDHNGKSDENWPDLATWIEEVWIGEE